MSKNPEKLAGKMKEQIATESKARREYPRKWSKFYNETPWDKMYNPECLSKQIKEQLTEDDFTAYKPKTEADGHFLSPGMYEALLTKCRCGRPHTDLHLLRCMQKQKPQFLPENDANEKKTLESKIELPTTSNQFIGWKKSKPLYQQWENSMKYYSPIYDMPGERITTAPYNVIHIG